MGIKSAALNSRLRGRSNNGTTESSNNRDEKQAELMRQKLSVKRIKGDSSYKERSVSMPHKNLVEINAYQCTSCV